MSLPISSTPAGIASYNGGELWSLVKARREARGERQEALAYVEQQLSSVLLGVELGEAEQAQYLSRLAQTAGTAQALREDLEVPELSEARVPRDLYIIKAGGISWRPFPLSQRQVEVTPLHRRLQARMAMAIKQRRKMAPESLPVQVHSIAFQYAGRRLEDRVEISGWGARVLARDNEKTLPLPASSSISLFPVSAGRQISP